MNYEFIRYLDEYIKQKRYRLINSVLLYKDNELILERYYNRFNELSRNNIKSIWKSILSICVGICIDKGYIKNLDEPILNYLTEFSENIHPYHKLITIRHLLTMTSGIYWNGGVHYHCPMMEQIRRSKNPIKELADTSIANMPGTKFVYKEFDVILLSALINRATKMSCYDFCKKYLYDPLDIKSDEWARLKDGTDYTVDNSILESRSDLSAKDLGKLGYMLLRNDGSVVNEKYILQATSPSACANNYGYLFWILNEGFAGLGYGGQELKILPDKNIVYVIQATATNQDKAYGDVFEELLKLI